MDKSTAVSFSYAKAAGLLSKSFINNKTQRLFEAETLADLWALLFKEPAPLIPETLLARELEEKAFQVFFDQYLFFLKQYDNPPLILSDKIKRFEIENLKEIIGALSAGEKELPHLLDLKDFSKINTKAWPDLAKMTAGTQYSWIKNVPSVQEQQTIEFKLDLQLLRENWKAITSCHGEDREGHEKLFLDEFIIKNIIWALRLKLYYEMPREEIIQNLFYVTDNPDRKDPVAAPAIKVLNYDVNKYEDWEKWEYAKYLNPYEPGEIWCVNPVWIERRYLAHQAKLAQQIFHQYVMEDVALAAWFKIKNYELTCIRTAVESLRLHIGSGEAMEAVGVNA
jgi:hypothetical protein